jgi:carboxyl-terminal processing protease
VGVALAAATFWVTRHGRGPAQIPTQDAHLLAESWASSRRLCRQTDDHQLMSNAIRGMVGELDHLRLHGQGRVRRPQDRDRGKYSGIGVEVTIEDNLLTVIALLDAATLGSKLVGYTGMHDYFARKNGDGPVDLRVFIDGQKKAELRTRNQDAWKRFEIPTEAGTHSVRFEMLEPGIGYLRISQFSETTGADTNAALRALERQAGGNLRGLVLDLRNNPGGVLDAAVEVSDAFLDKGTIVSAEGRSQESRFRMEAMSGLLSVLTVAVLVTGPAPVAESSRAR